MKQKIKRIKLAKHTQGWRVVLEGGVTIECYPAENKTTVLIFRNGRFTRKLALSECTCAHMLHLVAQRYGLSLKVDAVLVATGKAEL